MSEIVSQDPILIRRNSDPYGWMGNMSPYPIEVGGKTYRTTEALFQCMRYGEENDDVRELIRGARSPMQAKMISRQHFLKRCIAAFSPEDVCNMAMCLGLKLQQHPSLKEALLETNDREIIEDCTRRANESGVFWGAAYQDGKWVGENTLGRLWMKFRTKLRKREP